MRHFIVVVLTLTYVTMSYGQRNVAIQNGLGIYGGLTHFDIKTDNFETKSAQGWMGGLTAVADLPHKWYDVSYSIQLSENNLSIMAKPFATSAAEELDYRMLTAQVALLFHVKVIQRFLTVDLGPMIQYNGDLELKDERKEDFVLANYNTVLAKDIHMVSPFNVNGAVGATAGFNRFKLRAQYIYGFTNILNRLNKQKFPDETNTEKFKGNQSMLAFTAMIIF